MYVYLFAKYMNALDDVVVEVLDGSGVKVPLDGGTNGLHDDKVNGLAASEFVNGAQAA